MPSDEDQIRNLIALYAEKVDTAAFDEIGELFADGAIEVVHDIDTKGGRQTGSRETGRDAVTAWYRGAVATYGGNPFTRHVITNMIIEVDESAATARARTYFTVLQCLPDFPLQIIAAGRYHDSFARMAGGAWQFVEKTLIGDYIADISRHYRPLAFPDG